MDDQNYTQEIPKIIIPHRCAEFLRVRDAFDRDIAYEDSIQGQRARVISDGQVYRLKRAKAYRLNNHLSRCRECG